MYRLRWPYPPRDAPFLARAGIASQGRRRRAQGALQQYGPVRQYFASAFFPPPLAPAHLRRRRNIAFFLHSMILRTSSPTSWASANAARMNTGKILSGSPLPRFLVLIPGRPLSNRQSENLPGFFFFFFLRHGIDPTGRAPIQPSAKKLVPAAHARLPTGQRFLRGVGHPSSNLNRSRKCHRRHAKPPGCFDKTYARSTTNTGAAPPPQQQPLSSADRGPYGGSPYRMH